MQATIDDIVSADLDVDGGRPDDPTDFRVFVQIFVRTDPPDVPAGAEAIDVFSVHIVSARHLSRLVAAEGPQSGRHLIIVDHWDWDAIHQTLLEQFEGQEAATYEELMARLGRYGRWEFEDYVEPADDPPGEEVLRLRVALGLRQADDGTDSSVPEHPA
jgi:hypothetical protein